jgi:hypothetical protein
MNCSYCRQHIESLTETEREKEAVHYVGLGILGAGDAHVLGASILSMGRVQQPAIIRGDAALVRS